MLAYNPIIRLDAMLAGEDRTIKEKANHPENIYRKLTMGKLYLRLELNIHGKQCKTWKTIVKLKKLWTINHSLIKRYNQVCIIKMLLIYNP